LSGQNLAGMVLTVAITVLVGTAVVSMVFADFSHSSKREKENE
jgi:hypothetical protein